jgi:hypothetical protein
MKRSVTYSASADRVWVGYFYNGGNSTISFHDGDDRIDIKISVEDAERLVKQIVENVKSYHERLKEQYATTED